MKEFCNECPLKGKHNDCLGLRIPKTCDKVKSGDQKMIAYLEEKFVDQSKNHPPTIMEMATDFVNNAVNFIKSDHKLVSREKHDERYDICKKCKEWEPTTDKCRQCGCPSMNFKTWVAVVECPIHLWGKEDY